jgi:hypothetical protein
MGAWYSYDGNGQKPSAYETGPDQAVSNGINVVIGAQAGLRCSSGGNTFVGAASGRDHQYPHYGRTASFNTWGNVMLGYNVALGYGAAAAQTKSYQCTSLGAWADCADSVSGSTAIGANAYASAEYQQRIGTDGDQVRMARCNMTYTATAAYTPSLIVRQNATHSSVTTPETVSIYGGNSYGNMSS